MSQPISVQDKENLTDKSSFVTSKLKTLAMLFRYECLIPERNEMVTFQLTEHAVYLLYGLQLFLFLL